MIRGIGTDIIAVARIQRTIERNPRFMERVYTEAETAYCQAKANPWQSFAVRFAAKEAVMKAFGTGWDGKINWRDIEVGLDALGKLRFCSTAVPELSSSRQIHRACTFP
jgi:holo-[acyl-carrier protein] synthase